MFKSLRLSIGDRIELVSELISAWISLSGATAAAVFGRTLLAMFLGALALGLFLRIGRRKKLRRTAGATALDPKPAR